MKKVAFFMCLWLLIAVACTGCTSQTSPALSQAPATTTTTENTTTTATETTMTTTVTAPKTTQTTVSTTTVTTAPTTKQTTIPVKTTKKTTPAPQTVKTTTVSVTTQPPTANASAYVQEVFRLVNVEREKAGLAPLTYYAPAQAAADLRAREAAELFSHTRPNGEDCFTVLEEMNISYHAAGENIAAGYPDAASVMQGWMNSQGHKENILRTSYNAVVVGYHQKDGYAYWVQLFLGV